MLNKMILNEDFICNTPSTLLFGEFTIKYLPHTNIFIILIQIFFFKRVIVRLGNIFLDF